MNKWIKRISTAAASTALAGGALLTVSGTASAATTSAPGEHTQAAITSHATGGDHANGYWSTHHETQGDDSWGAPNGWYTNDDRQGHYGQERWNGRNAYVWDGCRWDEATTYRVSTERWYPDQIVWYTNQH